MPAFCGEMYVENDFLYRVEARILEKKRRGKHKCFVDFCVIHAEGGELCFIPVLF